MRIRRIIPGLVLLMSVSCATYKPDSYGVRRVGSNGRYIITEPHYKKRMNVVGVSSIAATSIAGGYAGYKSNAITYYKDGQKNNMPAVDAAIGTLIGFSVSYLANYLIGGVNKQKQYTDGRNLMKDAERWMKKAKISSDYKLIKSDELTLEIIDNSFESRFQPKNLNDVQEFNQAFGDNSSYLDDVIVQSLPTISRDEILILINKYPKTKSIDKLKYAYIERSTTVKDLFAAKNKFPDIDYDYTVNPQKINNLGDYLVSKDDNPDIHFEGEELMKIINQEVSLDAVSLFLSKYRQNLSKDVIIACEVKALELCNNLPELKKVLNEYGKDLDISFPEMGDIFSDVSKGDLSSLNKAIELSCSFCQKFHCSKNLVEKYNLYVKEVFYTSLEGNLDKIKCFCQNDIVYPKFLLDNEKLKSCDSQLKDGKEYVLRYNDGTVMVIENYAFSQNE